jgi:autophagy-related protein 9
VSCLVSDLLAFWPLYQQSASRLRFGRPGQLTSHRFITMASNILSRFLPSNATSPSIYEDLRVHDEGSEPSDVEERAGMAMDEANLGASFHDYDLDPADMFDGNESQVTTESTAFLPQNRRGGRPRQKETVSNRQITKKNSNWLSRSPRILEDDGDDDVPASLLIEGDDEPGPSQPQRHRSNAKPANIPGTSSRRNQAQWEATQAQQRLHQDQDVRPPGHGIPKRGGFVSNPREKAMWTWINASNLDHFVADVYDYYTGSGIWCICLERLLNLL